jgi:hypothetical protein
MKGLRRGLSALVSGFLLIGLITGSAWSGNIYVAPTGSGDGSIGSPTNLQSALTTALSATEGVTIFLQQGTYSATYDSYNSFVYAVTGTNTNAVELSGGWNPAFTSQNADNTLTVLDGQSARRVLKVTGDGTGVNFTFTIENLTIQNGKTNTYTAFPGETGYGAGISAMNLNSASMKIIIRNSQIVNNVTANGSSLAGGMFITCDYEIYDSTFSGNQTLYYGGAIFSSYFAPYTNSLAPIIDGCTFEGNTTTGAGGAHLFSYVSPVITNSKFIGLGGTTSSGGSGIMAYSNSFLTLENCIFSGNVTVHWSGAIQFWDSSGNITNTLFVNNKAGAVTDDGAGGVMDILWNAAATQPVVNITNCTFAGNRTLGSQGYGGAITLRGGAALNIVNSIFWDNGATAIYNEYSSLSIIYSDIQGGASGTGNINSDPSFVDAAGGDYRLQKGSPCIDKGSNVSGLPATDLSGDVRIYNSVVDMGAYEAQPIIGVSPVSLDFGDVMMGNNPDKPITVQSYGILDLVLGTIGSPLAPFSIVTGSQPCTNGQTLASGQSCTITIEFNSATAGAYNDNLGIPSNDLNNSIVTVPLSGSAVYIDPISPVDSYECTACSSYNSNWPTLQWDTNVTFKSVAFLFYLDSNPKKNVKLTAPAKAIPLKQLSITSASWNKILLLPGTAGGKVVWKIIGTEGDKKKTTLESPISSMQVDPPHPVGNPAISPTGITGTLPTLSWQNNCAVKFKVWFGNDSNFNKTTKKTSLSFTVKSPNDNGGVFTKQLTSGQWTTIKKLVGNSTTNPLSWYVESWDGLKRYTKTATEQFTLSQ